MVYKKGKNIITIIMISICAAIAVASYGYFNGNKENTHKEKLYVATWSKWLTQSFIDEFEKKNNCKLVLEFFGSSEEFFSKISILGSEHNFDIVLLSGMSGLIDNLNDNNLIVPIDASKVIRKKPKMYTFRDNKISSIIYNLGNSNKIFYNKKVMKDLGLDISQVRSISIFRNEAVRGKIAVMNDALEMVSYALRDNNLSVDISKQEEYDKVIDTLKTWRSNINIINGTPTDVITENLLFLFGDSHSIVKFSEKQDFELTSFSDIDNLYYTNDIILLNNKKDDLVYSFINLITQENHVDDICEKVSEKSYFGTGKHYVNLSSNKIKYLDAENEDFRENIQKIWLMFIFNSFYNITA